MPSSDPLKHLRLGVFGYGVEGRSVRAAIRRAGGAEPLVFNDTPIEGVEVAGPERLGEIELLVKSPGIKPSHPLLLQAAAAGLPVTTSTNLYLDAVRAAGLPVIGITGSKGKSTTSTLCAAILRQAGRPVSLVGNIGDAALDSLPATLEQGALTVFELSSYQCHGLLRGPDIAVVLCLFPQHMFWHGSYEDYRRDKLRIASTQAPGDLTLHHAAIPGPLGPARHEVFGGEGGLQYRDGGWYDDAQLLLADGDFALRGSHNRTNALAAFAAARQHGAEPEHLRRALAGFRGLPHRLEPLGTFADLQWVNDSISTAPEATVAALGAYPQADVLIVGGTDYGYDYRVLALALPTSAVRHVITLPVSGEHAARLIREAGVDVQIHPAADLAAAVAMAARVGRHTCLLSPGSPSFGQFRNFEQRGEAFRELVAAL